MFVVVVSLWLSFSISMPSTRSKAGGGGCGCGAACAVLGGAGVVVDDVVKEVRSAWADIDDDRVEAEDHCELHTKKYARLLLDNLVEEMEVDGQQVHEH